MKSKLNAFLNEIVTRKSVAYAAFTSYILVFVPLLIRTAEIFNFSMVGKHVKFFSTDIYENDSLFLSLLLFASVPALVLTLLLILIIPTYILYRKEKSSDFRLKHRPIHESPLYKGVLAFGCLLFCILLIALPIANIKFLYFVGYNHSGEYFDIFKPLGLVIISPIAMIFFLFWYSVEGIYSILLAILHLLYLLFKFHG